MPIDLRARQKLRVYILAAIVVGGPIIGYAIHHLLWWLDARAPIWNTSADTSTRLSRCGWAHEDHDDMYRAACEKITAAFYERVAASEGSSQDCANARDASRGWLPWPDDVEALCGWWAPQYGKIEPHRLLIGDVVRLYGDETGEILRAGPSLRVKLGDGEIGNERMPIGVVRLREQPDDHEWHRRGDVVAIRRLGQPAPQLAMVLKHDTSATWLRLGHDTTDRPFDGAVLRDGKTFQVVRILGRTRH